MYSGIVGLALLGTLFSGCSSGGSDSLTDDGALANDEVTITSGDPGVVYTIPNAQTIFEGTFIDSAVQGLSYKGNLDGVTDSAGHYFFSGTDRVEFLLGDKLSLGTLVPKTMNVSVLDFYDNSKNITDPIIQNLIVLLQSLDSDGDVSNGITILPTTIAILESQLLALDPTIDLTSFSLATMPLVDLISLLHAVINATPPVIVVTGPTTTTTVEDVVVSVEDAIAHFSDTLGLIKPPDGRTLACDEAVKTNEDAYSADDAALFSASETLTRNISSDSNTSNGRINGNSHNSFGRLNAVYGNTHPIVVSYNEQVVGNYEMGDGSADIGDPNQRDALFFSISLDNGETWNKQKISNSELNSSKQVLWNDNNITYYGHTQKPDMAIHGNNIVLAWNDKYCPSQSPFDSTPDVFAVNGEQGSVDYNGTIAPNTKAVYEVPFSCVWTARGVFSEGDGNVTWQAPKQLTSGTRDSNHIWLEGSEAGFALSWQEDTKGLFAGNGAGPGEGWSGATTNRGTDIWYTSIKNADLADDAKNFHYPVRITDNEKCTDGDTKAYCQALCDAYGSLDLTSGSGGNVTRCKSYDIDMLTNTQAVLDGDTGASRSALKILKTDADEYIVVLGYEETKGLSEKNLDSNITNIALEGKSVYFESFPFDAIDSFDEHNASSILTTPIPMVSAGNIVNVKVPDQNNTSELIYENARRLVIGTQIDSCDADQYTFAFMYKQSFEKQGASSDMFIRLNSGFTYDSFVAMDERDVTNVSAQNRIVVDNISGYEVNWDTGNLDDNTYENENDNTFSPRIFLRGNNIYTGFEYTPNEAKTKEGNMPSNFHTNIYADGTWQGPVNITQVTKEDATTVDARFFSTPKGSYATSGLDSDKSNPNVLFVTWGDMDLTDDTNASAGKTESDLWYKRSTDNGLTWDTNKTQLAAREGIVIEEKEVESFASPDGKTLYNVWLQEEAVYDATDNYSGLDSWFGRVDYNISIP